MFAHIALLGLAAVSGAGGSQPASGAPRAADASHRPRVTVWTSRGDDPYARGEGVRVFIRADQDAYVTLLRVDTDGRVRVLFPREPWEDNFVRGAREIEVQGYESRDVFQIDDNPGVGYLFAVAAGDPFVYDAIASGDHWDYRVIADGGVRGDPYVALTTLAQRIVPADYSDWDYDIVPYYVQQHYDYPRFLCYDCHTSVRWTSWDPYATSCVRFRIVVYDDPYYYPYRYYGTRAVFVRPFRPEPRFIFKDRDGAGDRFVTRERERPVNDDTRRGVIPAPRDLPRRDRPDQPTGGDGNRGGGGGEGRGGVGGGGGRRNQPDHPDHPDHRDHPDRPDHPTRPDGSVGAGGGGRDRPYRHSDGSRQQVSPPIWRPTDPQRGGGNGRDERGRPPEVSRPVQPRGGEQARVEPRSQPPRAESRRDVSPPSPPPPPRAQEKDKSGGGGRDNQPELRRRRP
jgi:hypothetical protein